jgi:aminopeptidase
MNAWRISAVLVPAMALLACKAASADTPRVDMKRMSEITRVLASDKFQGRAPGTPGEAKTIPYLIAQFKAAGLEPGGDNGGWTQAVPMIRTQLKSPMTLSVEQAGQTIALKDPDDLYLGTVRPVDRLKIANAPMVFVGYGVTAPERGWDDFKGADLKGKVAVMLVNDPDFEAAPGEPVAGKFGGKAMTYYGRWTYKYEEAARRGAIAALVVHETDAAGYPWKVVQSPAGESYAIPASAGQPQPVLLNGWIQRDVAAALLKRAGYDYETVKRQARTAAFRPIDLKAKFSADIPVDVSRIQSQNVIGKLTGSRYPQETVSYGGHWDA